MYLVFTYMPGESYNRRLILLLLYLRCVFRALINSLVCRLHNNVQSVSGTKSIGHNRCTAQVCVFFRLKVHAGQEGTLGNKAR